MTSKWGIDPGCLLEFEQSNTQKQVREELVIWLQNCLLVRTSRLAWFFEATGQLARGIIEPAAESSKCHFSCTGATVFRNSTRSLASECSWRKVSSLWSFYAVRKSHWFPLTRNYGWTNGIYSNRKSCSWRACRECLSPPRCKYLSSNTLPMQYRWV